MNRQGTERRANWALGPWGLAAALAAGCGGGASATDPPGASPPAAALVCPAATRDMRRVSMGFNVNALFWEGRYADPALQAAVRSLGQPTLRWPGGTESDYFDWGQGRPVDVCRYSACRTWDTLTLTPPGLFQRFGAFTEGTPANWARVAQATGARTLLVANLVTASQAEMLDWLQAAKTASARLDLLELGNEPYFAQVEGTDNSARVFPDAAAHVRRAAALASEVRRQHPDVTLAQPAFVPRIDPVSGQVAAGHDARMLGWNAGILAAGAAEVVDAFALHFYPQLPSRAGQPTAAYLRQLAGFARWYWDATRATPQWQMLPAGRRLWITEFNTSFALAPELQGSWLHGLFMAQFALLALEDARMDHLLAHMLTGNAAWQAVVHPGRVPDVPSPPAGEAYAATPAGVTLAAVSRAVQGMDCGAAISASQFPGLGTSVAPVGWQSSRGTAASAVLINMNDVAVTFDVRPGGWQEALGIAQRAAPLERATSASGIVQESLASVEGRVQVPPHAVVLLNRVAQ
jgi:hypothetical protein